MATATTEPQVTQTGTLLDRWKTIFGKLGFLAKHNVERGEMIELLGLCAVAGVDPLFLGAPGVGKTWAIELLVKNCMVDCELFSHLLAKDQSADETLGPKSVQALKEDKLRRMIEGMLPSANFAYLDEIFKASPPTVNPLLDVMATRQLKVGGQVVNCKQLKMIAMSSNELPEREDLNAFRDRIGVTFVVEAVQTAEGLRKVADIQLAYIEGGQTVNTTGLVPLTLEEFDGMNTEAMAVPVPDAIRDVMVEAQKKWLAAKHPPSQRRVGHMWRMVKTHAWAHGRKQVGADDLIVCQHMAFNNLDDRKSAREVILEFAGEYTRKAQRIKQSLEPLLTEMQALKAKIEGAETRDQKEELYDVGSKLLRKLRAVKAEGEEMRKEGDKLGQDTAPVAAVLDELDKAYAWGKAALTGLDN